MASKEQIYNWWVKAGFAEQEAQELTYNAADAEATYRSHAGIAARRERMKWMDNCRTNGWTAREFIAAVSAFYDSRNKPSPWDFIRENYRSIGVMPIKQYREMASDRAREKSARKTKELYNMC